MVELKCAAENRGRLDSAFQVVVSDIGFVCHLIPHIKVEMMNIDATAEDVEVEEAISNFLGEEMATKLKVSLTRRPSRETWKFCVTLEEPRAFRLLKAVYIKIEQVSCRVYRMTVTNRCHRCLDFGHIVALSVAKEKLRIDHLPGTMRCADFREAATKRRPSEAAQRVKQARKKSAVAWRYVSIDNWDLTLDAMTPADRSIN